MKQCRICLDYKRNLSSIFEKDQDISYANMMTSVARIKIVKDEWKNRICSQCCEELRRSYEFIKLIERSDMVLNPHLRIHSFNCIDDIKPKLVEECGFGEKQMNNDNIINDHICSLKNGCDKIIYNNTTIKKFTSLINYKEEINKAVTISNFNKIYETNHCHYEDCIIYDDLVECDELIREVEKTEKMQIKDIHLKGAKKKTKRCLSKLKKVRIKPIILDYIRLKRGKYTKNRLNAHKHRKRMNMCPHCGIMCGNINSHMMVHTGERKYKCSDCRKGFFTSKQLSKHQKDHLAARNFKCDHCAAVFNNKASLQSHMVSHIDDKNHICLVCNKGFKRKHSLLRHTLIHNSAAKSVKCELCNMSFLYKHSLQNHMRVHTGERPFKCEICSQPYSYKHDFNRHCLKKHGVYLKRRSIHLMTEEVLKQERELMKDVMVRIQGVKKECEPSKLFQDPHAALAFEHAAKALGSREFNAVM